MPLWIPAETVAFMKSSLLLIHGGSIPLSDFLGFPHSLSKYFTEHLLCAKPFQVLEKLIGTLWALSLPAWGCPPIQSETPGSEDVAQ